MHDQNEAKIGGKEAGSLMEPPSADEAGWKDEKPAKQIPTTKQNPTGPDELC